MNSVNSVPFQAYITAQLFERHFAFAVDGKISITEKVLLKAGLDSDEVGFVFRYLRERGIYTDCKTRSVGVYDPISDDHEIDFEDRDYLLTINEEKLRSLLKEAVNITGDLKSEFDEETSILKIGEHRIQIPPGKNEYNFCRVMFLYPPLKFVDWSEIYEKITGCEDIQNTEKAKKMVSDTRRAINNRIRNQIKEIENVLFTWEMKTLRREY